ncbi:hypothetical protein [Streptomyces sp. DW26H14]|uniref:hypothetical protein n=1 Tax=Streptomyces sp. DW26H14 TaxID=3435395 RepID=UPI00403E2633
MGRTYPVRTRRRDLTGAGITAARPRTPPQALSYGLVPAGLRPGAALGQSIAP